MREINEIITTDLRSADKLHKNYIKKLKYLFKNPKFIKAVKNIRIKFNVPAMEIKRKIGASDVLPKQDERQLKKNHRNLMSILHSNVDFHSLGYKGKSKKIAYQKEVTKLRRAFHLPARFQKTLADYVVLHDRFPTFYSHVCPCPLTLYDDNGEKRIKMEVFADTDLKDVISSWKSIKWARDKYLFDAGSYFNSYDDYFLGLLIEDLRKNKKYTDTQIYYAIRDEVGIDEKRLKDDNYVRVIRQRYNKFIKRIEQARYH